MRATPDAGWPPEAAILGLDPGEIDPVRIILAARQRLRHCRLGHGGSDGGPAAGELRQIISARDALLRRAVGAMANGGDAGGPAPRG